MTGFGHAPVFIRHGNDVGDIGFRIVLRFRVVRSIDFGIIVNIEMIDAVHVNIFRLDAQSFLPFHNAGRNQFYVTRRVDTQFFLCVNGECRVGFALFAVVPADGFHFQRCIIEDLYLTFGINTIRHGGLIISGPLVGHGNIDFDVALEGHFIAETELRSVGMDAVHLSRIGVEPADGDSQRRARRRRDDDVTAERTAPDSGATACANDGILVNDDMQIAG